MFGGVKVIAYLQSSSLELFGEDIDSSEIAIFPQNSIHNISVTHEDKLKQTIIGFLAKSGLKKQKVVVVLGEGVLYEKSVRFTTKEQVKKQAEEFFDSVPFPKVHIAKTTLTNDKEVYFIATNKELYKIVAESFLAIGWKMESVVPITLFGFPDKKLSKQRAKEILKNTEAVKLGNFLLENPIDFAALGKLQETIKGEEGKKIDEEKEEEQETKETKGADTEESVEKSDSWGDSDGGGKKKFLFLPLITIVVGAGFYALLHFHIVYIPLLQKDTITTVTLTPKVTQSPSPSPTPIKKEDLKLQAQNGTGTPGQAKLVKVSLTALGYKTIDTTNAEKPDNTDTILTFGSGVSKEDRDAITKELKKSFKNVVLKDSSPGSYDVVIVTGSAL